MARPHFEGRYGASPPENYERFFVPTIGRPLAVELVREASPRPGERVLDVGCGTGVVARLAATDVGPDGAVVGLDVDPGMLATARSANRASGIEWYEASADRMPFADATFDVVLSQMSLQFVPDRLEAVREMRRVLTPGGRLVVNVPGPSPAMFRILADAMSGRIGPKAGGFVGAVFALHDEAEVEGLLESAGFREVAVRADARELRLPGPGDFLWQYVSSTPLAALVAEAGEEAGAALERDVVAGWAAFAEGDGMRLHLRLLTATARR